MQEKEKHVIVEMLKYPTDKDWWWVKEFALNTIGKKSIEGKEVTLDWKRRMLFCEHSPIRTLWFTFKLTIPYCNSTCFVRHKHGVEHFVQSQRNDRQDKYDRYEAPQGSPVSHIMVVNAQELMFIMRKRLCCQADPVTREIARGIRDVVYDKCPEFKGMLVRPCEWNGGVCHEMFPCPLAEAKGMDTYSTLFGDEQEEVPMKK